MCGRPEEGVAELNKLNRAWIGQTHPIDHNALAVALGELVFSEVVTGRTYLRALLVTSMIRSMNGETAQLLEVGQQILRLSQDIDDESAECKAWCLIGDAYQARGKLESAWEAFAQYLDICLRIAELDPHNPLWQRDMAVACLQIARLAARDGIHDIASLHYDNFFRILKKLVYNSPPNTQWEQEISYVEVEYRRYRKAYHFHS